MKSPELRKTKVRQSNILTIRGLATEYHLGLLKAKLAKYRSQLLETQEKASGKACSMFPLSTIFRAKVSML